MVRKLLILIMASVMLTGCAGFWDDQGEASRTSAEARLRQAEAARQNAQAAIIDAEARGALAASQAEALRTTIDANSDLMRQAVDLADNGEYVWLFAAVALGVLAFAGWAIWATHRRPAAVAPPAPAGPRQVARIETVQGQWLLEQGEGESHAAFLMRVQALAAQAAARERVLLEGPR